MKRLAFVLTVSVGLCCASGFLSGCPESEPDSVELGCRTDSDCYKPGEPERWCQSQTGICMTFTSQLGETEEKDAAAPPPSDSGTP